MRRSVLIGLVVLAGTAAACASSSPSGQPGSSTSGSSTSTSTPTSTSTIPAAASSTVWLCRPGAPADPCAAGLDATVVTADGSTTRQPASAAGNSRFNCFYVYPTVSDEPGNNANLAVQPSEINVAVLQASRFSSVCNVWAPMYRQATLSTISSGKAVDPSVVSVAYSSLLSAWQDFIAHYDDGRPFVLIGHSQGAAMLIKLIAAEVDPNAALRHLLVSAIVLGGNVQVPTGADVGGVFKNIPGCHSATQTGCVIAYSSFLLPPPADSLFARPGQGVSYQSGQTTSAGQQVLCTNPAALEGGSGALMPYLTAVTKLSATTPPATDWMTYPDFYSAKCMSAGGASWLQVTYVSTRSDPRPRFTQSLGPEWGLHLYDVNLALGNLVQDVASEESAYH